jgi:radical SAM protein with 4Fe4S-binding SPASM domain
MDVDYHSFSPLRDLPLDQTLAPPSSRVWSKLSNKLIKFDEYYFSKKGQKGIILNIHLASKKYIYRIIARSLSGERWPFKCLSGEFIGVINPNGDVKLCESTETIGNLRKSDYNFKKVWFSEKANKMRRLKLEGKLKKCYGCTNACFLLPSLVYNPGHLMRVLVSPFV